MSECAMCGAPVPPASRGVTCGFSCRAKLRESRKTTEWRKQREYPADLIERVRELYVDRGLTIAEVGQAVGPGVKVQLLLVRCGIDRRAAGPRDQTGERNATWRGDSPTYAAAHTRVYTTRGAASEYACIDCGEPAHDWSYVGGCPRQQEDSRGRTYSPDPAMYSPRCRRCHRAFDFKGRRPNGQFVRRGEAS